MLRNIGQEDRLPDKDWPLWRGNLSCCLNHQQAQCTNLGNQLSKIMWGEGLKHTNSQHLVRTAPRQNEQTFFSKPSVTRNLTLRCLKSLFINTYKKFKMLFSSRMGLSFFTAGLGITQWMVSSSMDWYRWSNTLACSESWHNSFGLFILKLCEGLCLSHPCEEHWRTKTKNNRSSDIIQYTNIFANTWVELRRQLFFSCMTKMVNTTNLINKTLFSYQKVVWMWFNVN